MIKNWLKRLKEDERGLTLVELLAVVVVLGIIGGIAFVSVGNIIDNTKQDTYVANAQQVLSAAKLYEASGGEIGTTAVAADGTFGEHISTLTDPWDNQSIALTDVTAEKSADGVYSVTLPANGDGSSCAGTHTESDILAGREVVCSSGGGQ